ncbi:MAG: hypothetical protein WBF90_02420 [Rivularia sp. (in: cyanobacteria)]|jgi:hypothetical protein
MNYLVAVFPDRMTAEEASIALEKKGIKSSILGRGYKSADEFGLIDPKEEAKKQAKFMSYWLVPFGFFAGFAFNLITGIDTFAWAGAAGNRIIGGLLGAGSGALGAIFVGGGVGLVVGGGDALPYRNRLDAGKYIIVVEGAQSLNRETTRILRQLDPENIQGYAAE